MKQEMAALRALGLTEYGARAYHALVSLGPCGAADVAEAGPVPRTKVYAVLADLARRGWIDVEQGRPRTYRAMRPQECFDRERERLDALCAAALPTLEASYRERATRFGGPLWVLQGGAAVAQRAQEMVGGAKKDVLLIAAFPLSGDERALPRALRDAARRGVRVRVALPDPDAEAAKPFALPGIELRGAAGTPRILFVDGQQALVAVPAPGPDGKPDVRGIWNPSAELVSLMAGFLLDLWDKAEGATVLIPTPPAKRGRGK